MPCVVPAAALAPDPAVPQQTRARLAQARGLTLGALSPGFAHTAPSADMSPHPHVPAPLGGTCTQKPSCTRLCPEAGPVWPAEQKAQGAAPRWRPDTPLLPLPPWAETTASRASAAHGAERLGGRARPPASFRLPAASPLPLCTAPASSLLGDGDGDGDSVEGASELPRPGGGDQDTVWCAATRGGGLSAFNPFCSVFTDSVPLWKSHFS